MTHVMLSKRLIHALELGAERTYVYTKATYELRLVNDPIALDLLSDLSHVAFIAFFVSVAMKDIVPATIAAVSRAKRSYKRLAEFICAYFKAPKK